uniref:Cyclin-C n=1 Tax=Panagrellus redivivus TaxID=6233 RepID=A0A7E5A1D4_PANRE
MAGNFWKSSHYEQWILDKQDLYRQRGDDLKVLTEDEYHKVMILFMDMIKEIASNSLLNCRMQMIATACTYFRRFYARRSLKDVSPFLMAPTCLILASKVDEHGNMSQNKLSQALTLVYKKVNFPVNEHNIIRTAMEAEFYLLEIMDCSLLVYHPYRTLLQLCQELRDMKLGEVTELINDSWRVTNDSYRTDAILMYCPHQIAIACMMLATIINNKEDMMRPFFAELVVDWDAVFEVIQLINASYKLFKQVELIPANEKAIAKLLEKIPKPSAITLAPPPQKNLDSTLNMLMH